MGTINPVSSAIGINSSGEIIPRWGCFHLNNASKPQSKPVSNKIIG